MLIVFEICPACTLLVFKKMLRHNELDVLLLYDMAWCHIVALNVKNTYPMNVSNHEAHTLTRDMGTTWHDTETPT